jgi:hypothetical protein
MARMQPLIAHLRKKANYQEEVPSINIIRRLSWDCNQTGGKKLGGREEKLRDPKTIEEDLTPGDQVKARVRREEFHCKYNGRIQFCRLSSNALQPDTLFQELVA